MRPDLTSYETQYFPRSPKPKPTAPLDEIIAWHETRRDEEMAVARAYRDQLDGLEQLDPEEYERFDRERTLREPVMFARWHNRVAWVARWQEKNELRQASLFAGLDAQPELVAMPAVGGAS